MSDWYYADARNTRHGPVSHAALLQLREDGIVNAATLLWRDGMQDWAPYRELAHELDPAAASHSAGNAPATAAHADAWALEPVLPSANDVMDEAADSGWRPLTDDAGDAAGTAHVAASPYAPPTSNVARPGTVVRGGDVVMAGFRKRAAAYLIDTIIVGIAGAMVAAFLLSFIGVAGLGRGFLMTQVVTNLLSIGLSALYYAWFHASHSMATPGKMAVGIKVVRSDGARISMARGIGRYFATILSGLILCIGFLMAAFTQRKQALHDMICDTLVVDRWAFTDRPDLQRRDLGTVTVVVLVIGGILVGLGLLGILAAIGIAAFS